MSRPLLLPRLTSSETQALAALTTQGLGHTITLPHGRQALLRLAPLPPGQAPVQATDMQRLRMEWGGSQLALDISASSMDAWVQLVLDTPALVSLPAAFRQAALDHVVQWVTASLGQAGRGQAVVTGMAAATEARPADAPHALALELSLDGGPVLPCLVHMDSLALMLVGSLAQSAPAAHGAQSMETLPVVLTLCVGETTLPLKLMRQLRAGGLVFLTQSHVQDGQGVRLCAPLGQRRIWSAQARLQDAQLLLTAHPITMTTPTDSHPESGDSPLSLEDMPVHLSFDVGQKTLTLAQLRQLGEGQALALDREIQSAVSIRANGALIGQGQLVDIDGRLGVLINQLQAPAAHQAD